MLSELHLRDVGPAPALDVEFAERLNIFTGDNGLGKTFLLDCAWWALTDMWRVEPQPRPRGTSIPEIRGEVRLENWTAEPPHFSAEWQRLAQTWNWGGDGHLKGCLVLYSTVDGEYAIYDPARTHSVKRNVRRGDTQFILDIRDSNSFHFDRDQVWDGLKDREANAVYCNGLIDDWNRWQLLSRIDGNIPFPILERVIHILSHPDEPLQPGPPRQLSIRDVREIPTLITTYGEVPITQASAGVKRIVSLAYLLVWMWVEHIRASELRGEKPADRIVLLIDEVELHLHPRWQRSIVPALMEVAKALSGQIETQLIFTTHSPLVLASIEPEFDEERDRLFLFDIEGGQVKLNELPWCKQGDASNWLTSPIFGLSQARSIEAERAIIAANAFMRGDMAELPEGLRTKEQIHEELCRVLAGHDRFWPRWIVQDPEDNDDQVRTTAGTTRV